MYNDFVIPILNITTFKRLEERKLMEDSETNLIKQLFGYKEDLVLEEINNQPLNVIEKFKNKVSNKTENELKQKELSKQRKEKKLKENKNFELYGKSDGDYEYEDKNYN